MAPAGENVQTFQWDYNRIQFVPITTKRPTFIDHYTTSSNVYATSYEIGHIPIGIYLFIIIIGICTIYILWIFCHNSSYRSSSSVTTRDMSPITSFHQTQTENHLDTAIFSFLQLHTFSPSMSQDISNDFSRGNMADDPPPSYFDVILMNSSGDNTKLTEITETPPPNYEEDKQEY